MIYAAALCLSIISGTYLSPQHYVAIVAVALSFAGFFIFRQYYRYFFYATFVLGLFNLIRFSPVGVTFGVGLLKIQGLSFLVGVLMLIMYYSKVVKLLSKEPSQKQQQIDKQAFIDLYRQHSPEKLEKILNDQRYTETAREAAVIVLAELRDRSAQNL